ncbi:HNH endonuclease [Pseudomonas asiatica]|uniref:HNH endonuclease n=1 Tax=Pseudomonas asiatica TaxID=2219225 RepID=UPI00209AB11C|nr:HNH endonuclease [Pseudomonas asiatica]MCO7536337.1 HNH endonuclease [Pseudomonas asiatica]MCO7550100.1 HNH endonuclease [Pseudomonas asiatica]MCO7560353.1 HNH endonuclease [Pseudomonas asiatica]
MTGRNWFHAAGILWPRLVEAASKRQTPTYGELSPLVQTNPLSMRYALDPIQVHCLDAGLPPLSSIVIGAVTGVPGPGFIGWPLDDIDTAHELVFAYDWSQVANPYEAFGVMDTPESLAHSLVENPENREDVYAKVKVRGIAQTVFKKALMLAYRGQCAMCKLSFPQALDAAHIIPWTFATPGQRLDPRNGLLLCSLHHRLFDGGVITITPDARVHFCDPEMADGPYSHADENMTAGLHGKAAHLPDDPALGPSREALADHYQRHSWVDVPAALGEQLL